MAAKEAKAPAFTKFLRRVIREYSKGSIWLYTDNLPVHKSKKGEKLPTKPPLPGRVEVSTSLLPRPQPPEPVVEILRGGSF